MLGSQLSNSGSFWYKHGYAKPRHSNSKEPCHLYHSTLVAGLAFYKKETTLPKFNCLQSISSLEVMPDQASGLASGSRPWRSELTTSVISLFALMYRTRLNTFVVDAPIK